MHAVDRAISLNIRFLNTSHSSFQHAQKFFSIKHSNDDDTMFIVPDVSNRNDFYPVTTQQTNQKIKLSEGRIEVWNVPL